MDEDIRTKNLGCVVEGCDVTTTIAESEDGQGIVIRFWNFLPEYAEYYAWCGNHRPAEDEVEKIGQTIKSGTSRFEPSFKEDPSWPGDED